MSEALSDIMSQMQLVIIIIGGIILALYILTIAWVIKDASQRGVSPVKWGIIAIIPFIGALIYSALRPAMLATDREEQELDYLLRQRQLMQYGECGRCSYPVQDDYIMCPNCGSQLKNVCSSCGKPLNPEWSVCPYCCTKVRGRNAARRGRRNAEGKAAAAAHAHAAHENRAAEEAPQA